MLPKATRVGSRKLIGTKIALEKSEVYLVLHHEERLNQH